MYYRIAYLCCLFVLTVSCGSATSPSTPTLKIIERHGTPGTSHVSCQSGEHLESGLGPISSNPVQASYPSDDNTWSIEPADSGATAFADCLVSNSAETFIVHSDAVGGTQPGSWIQALASCPLPLGDYIVTGGGFKENSTKLIIEASAPNEERVAWFVGTHLSETGQNLIQAFAVCLKDPFKAMPGEPFFDFSVQPQGSTSKQASCAQDYLLASGGYITTSPGEADHLSDTFATNIYPLDSPAIPSAPSGELVKAWSLTAQNNAKESTRGFVEVVCIKHT